MNLQEQMAHIERRQQEVRQFAVQMREASAREVQSLSPMSLFFAGTIGGAMCFFAGMATMKLLG